MKTSSHHHRVARLVGVVVGLVAWWPPAHPALGQSAGGTTNAPPTDTGWPRTHQKDGQTVVIYQPQVDEWKDQKMIAFRAATAVTLKGAAEPVYGVIEA